jgi:hypothetical protein
MIPMAVSTAAAGHLLTSIRDAEPAKIQHLASLRHQASLQLQSKTQTWFVDICEVSPVDYISGPV